MEDYLKAIYYLQQESNGRVKTSAIAEYIGVGKLSEQGLIHHEPYKGVELTDTGTPIALELTPSPALRTISH